MTGAAVTELQPLSSLRGRELRLPQHGFSVWASWDLVAGGDRLGSMFCVPDGSIMTPLRVSLASGSWDVRGHGLSTLVRETRSGEVAATFTPRWLGLRVDLPDGSRFTGSWETWRVFAWRDSQGQAVLRHETTFVRLWRLRPMWRFWFLDGCETQAYASLLAVIAMAAATGAGGGSV
jgi:hypothetical protein